MKKRDWEQLMSRLGFSDNQDVYEQLISHYNQKHRKYHNTAHLEAVLEHCKSTSSLATNANAVEVALWFHDAIYQIFSASNEQRSADWATHFLQQNEAEETFVENVYRLIMSTRHNYLPTDNDERLIVDIDLSILGTSPHIYAQFETAIREEYKRIPWFIYRKKRLQVLNRFLDRKTIFSHKHFREKLEANARCNLERAVQKLQCS